MKAPKKADLYEQIAHLEKENSQLIAERDRKKQEMWEKKRQAAFDEFKKFTESQFPNLVVKVILEHIDDAGYWFTFELKNDSRRQTYAVRHSDLKEEE